MENPNTPKTDCKFLYDYFDGKATERDILIYMIPWLKGERDMPLAQYIGLNEYLLQWCHYESNALRYIAYIMRNDDEYKVQQAEEEHEKYLKCLYLAQHDEFNPMNLIIPGKRKWPEDVFTMYYENEYTLAKAWRIHNKRRIEDIAKQLRMTVTIYSRLENQNYYPYIIKQTMSKVIGVTEEELNPLPYKPWTKEAEIRYERLKNNK